MMQYTVVKHCLMTAYNALAVTGTQQSAFAYDVMAREMVHEQRGAIILFMLDALRKLIDKPE